MNNPLITNELFIQFSKVKSHHIEPAINFLLAANKKKTNKLLAEKPASWNAFMPELEVMNAKLHTTWAVVENLNAVVNTPSVRKAHDACLPKISAYFTWVAQNRALFRAIKALSQSKEYQTLNQAQKKIIANNLRDFTLAGIDLSAKKRAEFKRLDQNLVQLSSRFANNVLDATQGWYKLITNKKELSGIPDLALQTAQALAKKANKTGWLFTLDAPSYLAIMTYADSRELRQEFYTAYVTRASELGPTAKRFDNGKIMQQILRKKTKLAKLVKYHNYAEYSLATKMAKTPKEVLALLHKLARVTKNKAKKELAALKELAATEYNVTDLKPWDLAYFSEKLKQKNYNISDEELRPYFPEQQVLSGLFNLAHKLFAVTIKEKKDIDVWHKDVKVYELYDKNKKLRSIFYLDLYARTNKRSGAWMSDARSKSFDQLPVAFIVANFSEPTAKLPALLNFHEVETIFHEFGHALQHMLTTVNYSEVSGINGIPWDAVELASQFMENWCWQKPVIAMISKHYKTGKKLPAQIFKRMLAARNFQSGLQMLRQIEFALFDFRLHQEFSNKKKNQIQQILNEVRSEVALIPQVDFNRFQNSFSHIFAGGYAAGYYSYKWAEVLSADAFSKFEADGLFNKATGDAFLHSILEPGGSVDPAILFKKFRGRAPSIMPLLKHADIVD